MRERERERLSPCVGSPKVGVKLSEWAVLCIYGQRWRVSTCMLTSFFKISTNFKLNMLYLSHADVQVSSWYFYLIITISKLKRATEVGLTSNNDKESRYCSRDIRWNVKHIWIILENGTQISFHANRYFHSLSLSLLLCPSHFPFGFWVLSSLSLSGVSWKMLENLLLLHGSYWGSLLSF